MRKEVMTTGLEAELLRKAVVGVGGSELLQEDGRPSGGVLGSVRVV